jgi:GDP-4-dehydro-6-deoxy-D-mannose reductase
VNPSVSGLPLVTGATGFAGSHLLERLLESHERVHAWAHSSAPAADPRIHWHTVDLVNRDSVERALADTRPSVIYHLAGLPHVAESWTKSRQALHVNAFGTHLLLDAITRLDLDPLVVVVSSALVYRPAAEALAEDHPLGPADPYGVSKLAQEMSAVRSRVRAIVARPFNHAGPRQSTAFALSSFARQIVDIETGRAAPVLHVGNLDARRDITDVRDTVRAYERLATSGQPGRPYNVCRGTAYRVGDLLGQLLGMAQVRVEVKQDPERMRPSDNPLVLGNPARVTGETGWRAEIPMEQTLRDLLEWWRQRSGDIRQ